MIHLVVLCKGCNLFGRKATLSDDEALAYATPRTVRIAPMIEAVKKLSGDWAYHTASDCRAEIYNVPFEMTLTVTNDHK